MKVLNRALILLASLALFMTWANFYSIPKAGRTTVVEVRARSRDQPSTEGSHLAR